MEISYHYLHGMDGARKYRVRRHKQQRSDIWREDACMVRSNVKETSYLDANLHVCDDHPLTLLLVRNDVSLSWTSVYASSVAVLPSVQVLLYYLYHPRQAPATV